VILFAADMLQVAPDFLWYFRATAWLLKAKHQIFVGIFIFLRTFAPGTSGR